MSIPKLFVIAVLLLVFSGKALAGEKNCPKRVVFSDLAIEGILMEVDEMDGFFVNITLLPGGTGDSHFGILALHLESEAHMQAARKLRSGARVQVVYNMVQEYSHLAGECLVGPVAKTFHAK